MVSFSFQGAVNARKHGITVNFFLKKKCFGEAEWAHHEEERESWDEDRFEDYGQTVVVFAFLSQRLLPAERRPIFFVNGENVEIKSNTGTLIYVA